MIQQKSADRPLPKGVEAEFERGNSIDFSGELGAKEGNKKSDSFDILKHLSELSPDGGSQGKHENSYHCPLCNAQNFKVTITGKNKGKYHGYGCDCMSTPSGKQAIINAISPAWEKPPRPKKTQVYGYDTIEGGGLSTIVKVTRKDNGQGQRKFSQSAWDGRRWKTGLTDEAKEQIHLYRIFDPINQDAIGKGDPIFIVEGEGKVEALHRLGIAATCSIGGAGKWKAYGYPNYLEDLKGANLVICPDRDQPGIKHAEQIAEDFPTAPWLYAAPKSYMWSRNLPSSKGYDVADWIEDGATKEDVIGAIEPKRIPEKEPTAKPESKVDSGERSRLQRDYDRIEHAVGEGLAFDEATQNFYLEGEPLDLDTARLTLAIDYGLNLYSGKEDTSDICVRLAQINRFNSVVDYLESCQQADPIDLLTLAPLLFGTTDPLHAVYLKKWLISAVARAKQPGVKSDDTLILQGKQGQLKSSFFSGLVPNPEWFNANGLKGGKINEDEVRTAHRVWLIEVPEIDKLFKKACASELKAFMTLQREWIRPLYAKMPVQLLRHSLMAGTTNEPEFFTDTTGNRRYWVCPVSVDKIDVAWVAKNRDRIWANALSAYKAGEPHWLTREEEQAQELHNRQYQVEHPWLGLIEQYTHGLEEVTIGELLFRLLKIEIGKAGRSEQMQAAGILKSLGFQKTSRRKVIEDQRQTIWFRGEAEKGMDGMDHSKKEDEKEW